MGGEHEDGWQETEVRGGRGIVRSTVEGWVGVHEDGSQEAVFRGGRDGVYFLCITNFCDNAEIKSLSCLTCHPLCILFQLPKL